MVEDSSFKLLFFFLLTGREFSDEWFNNSRERADRSANEKIVIAPRTTSLRIWDIGWGWLSWKDVFQWNSFRVESGNWRLMRERESSD
jgi:hypothetical protein